MYSREIEFLQREIPNAFRIFHTGELKISQKSEFDLVTETDKGIERYLTEKIRECFPSDTVQGEEYSPEMLLSGRSWSIDPIDGTCNMANGIRMYGVQAVLTDNGILSAVCIYLPFEDMLFTAERGKGAYCNGERISVNSSVKPNNAVLSFGDYPHRSTTKVSDIQNCAIRRLYTNVAKIRMLGAACYDFAYLALGMTHGTALTTTNLWDLGPGILLCKEAGAAVCNLEGREWKPGDEGVIACANNELLDMMAKAYENSITLEINKNRYTLKGIIFDFDGVVMDTEKYHYLAWKEAFEKYSCTLSRDQYLPLKSTGGKYISDTVPGFSGHTLTQEEKNDVIQTKDNLFTEMCKGLDKKDFVPGCLDFINICNNNCVKCAVASSSRTTAEFFQKFDLNSIFDYKIDGTCDLPRKPDPAFFLNAAENLYKNPSECIVFEDSLAGIEAAKRANIPVIAIGGIKSEDALLCVEDFTDVITLIVK